MCISNIICLLYLIHGVRWQRDGIGVRAETDFRGGRDHDSVPDARREVGQQQGRRAGADRHVAQHVPAGAALDDHLVADDHAVVRVLRRRVPLQVHRARVVRGRLDVSRRLRRAWKHCARETVKTTNNNRLG